MNHFISFLIAFILCYGLSAQKNNYQSEKKIFFVKYKYQADLTVYFVNYTYQCGWKNEDQKHLLY